MLRYIVRRLLMMIPVLIGATLIVFAIMDSSPGDPALSKVGVEASPEQVEEMRESMGLNDPFFIRYGRFLLGLLHGDLGTSYKNDLSVMEQVMSRLPNTFILSFAALLFAMAVGIPVGIISARRQYTMMDVVGLARRLINSYPHELDGGRRQRIGIARALALNPKFIVCDEPVSALDVSIQAQVLNLMQDLQQQMGLTYLFITHNLAVVKHLSDQIVVMYLGQLVEQAPPEELFRNPKHPYTKALLSAIPVPDPDAPMNRTVLKGEITSPINVKPGCRFAKRCIYATEECTRCSPEEREVSPGHFVACHQVKD